MSKILEVNDISKNFGGVRAVKHANMLVNKGEVVGLIGPNGAGKTTLFNMITGLVTPSAGSISFSDEEIKANLAGKRSDKISRLGICRTFQNIRLFSRLSVIDNVRIGAHSVYGSSFIGSITRNRKEKKTEKEIIDLANDCLDFVGLKEYSDEQACNLPYGYQRRLEIARALAGKPRLLLLDEPAAGMNPSETSDLKILINNLLQKGLTLFIIEHDMSLVMATCGRIYVLDEGALIAEGTPCEIQQNSKVIEAYLGSGAAWRKEKTHA